MTPNPHSANLSDSRPLLPEVLRDLLALGPVEVGALIVVGLTVVSFAVAITSPWWR